jgi:alpha/beta superfamily hydrolase
MVAMDPTPAHEPFLISGPAGRIEGKLELPPANSRPNFLAVFAHPHPRYGGTMQNSVVVRAARTLAQRGGVVARFNFRGVGRSEGSYDEGRGEVDDFVAVAEWLDTTAWATGASARRVAAGFSFGSLRALEACARGAADRWLGVAPPLTLAPTPVRHAFPAALVLASDDQLAPALSATDLAARFADLRAVEVVAGASHMFVGRFNELARAVDAAAQQLLR